MVGAHQNLNGLRDLTTPISGTICHMQVSTYGQPIHPLQTYERRYKIWKVGWFGVVRIDRNLYALYRYGVIFSDLE